MLLHFDEQQAASENREEGKLVLQLAPSGRCALCLHSDALFAAVFVLRISCISPLNTFLTFLLPPFCSLPSSVPSVIKHFVNDGKHRCLGRL